MNKVIYTQITKILSQCLLKFTEIISNNVKTQNFLKYFMCKKTADNLIWSCRCRFTTTYNQLCFAESSVREQTPLNKGKFSLTKERPRLS